MLLLPGWGMSRASRRAAGFRMGKSSSTISCCWAWRGASRARRVAGGSQSRAATRLTIPASSSMYRDLSSCPAGNAGRGVILHKGVPGMELRPCAIVRPSVIQRGISAHRNAQPQDPSGSAKQSSGQWHRSASGQPDGRHRAAAGLWGTGLLHHLPGAGQRGRDGSFPSPTGGTGDAGGVGSVGPLPAGLPGQGFGGRGSGMPPMALAGWCPSHGRRGDPP